jgi:hypothetical protein
MDVCGLGGSELLFEPKTYLSCDGKNYFDCAFNRNVYYPQISVYVSYYNAK